ncbi:helix-turn-helix domain-containing protein [Streptomyces sp. NPDC056230]|uniref:helix-turn-helix domain-containing protein n=1 Tax=Streptomyces sp. NPDC056230 TaxID=3345754 RepID=UPI0035E1E59C
MAPPSSIPLGGIRPRPLSPATRPFTPGTPATDCKTNGARARSEARLPARRPERPRGPGHHGPHRTVPGLDGAIARRLRRGVAGDLIRRFSDVVGTAPSGYLPQWRTDLTSQWPRGTGGSAETVARMVGHTSVAAFTRAFTRAHSRSPGSFRRAFAEVANRSAKDRS